MFMRTNDSFTLVPHDTPEKLVQHLREHLKTEVVRTSIGETNMIGVYSAMNSNGIVLPNIATQEEVAAFKALGLNVYHSKEPSNAHGNNVSASDKGGLLNPHISRAECKRMEDVLGIELVQMHIAKYATVGSACLPGNNGFLIHYAANDDELKAASDALKVKGDRGTVNMGTGFVAFGIMANRNGYVSGAATTAFELGRAESALGYI